MEVKSSLFGTAHGNLTAKDGAGGTLQAPSRVAGNLGLVQSPDGRAYFWANTAPDEQDVDACERFESWKIHGPAIPSPDQVREGLGWVMAYTGVGERTSYYGEGTGRNPGWPSGHYLRPGELLPVWTSSDLFSVPDDATIAAVDSLARQVLAVDRLESMERYQHFLAYYEDKDQPSSTPYGETDIGFVRGNRYLMGGAETRGFYNGTQYEADQFGANAKYSQPLWHVLRFLQEPTERNWAALLYLVFHHLCYGRMHSGPSQGMSRYPKSSQRDAPIGDSPSWISDKPEKQFAPTGVWLTWLLCGQAPVIGIFLDEWREYLLGYDVSRVWTQPSSGLGAYYGARRPMRHFLELCLGLGYDPHNAAEWQAKAEELALMAENAWVDSASCFPNTANDPNMSSGKWRVDSRPWFQWKLLGSMLYSIDQGLLSETWVPKIAYWAEKVWADPTSWHETRNGRVLAYDYAGGGNQTIHNTGWILTGLEHLASRVGGEWLPRRDEMKTLLAEYAGSYVQDLDEGKPVPLSELGAQNGRNGQSWPIKSAGAYLEGSVL